MPSALQHLRARKRPWPAAPPRPAPVIDYPDLGVEPVIPEHRLATTDGTQRLEDRFAHRADVYVGSNMTMYYVEGSEEHSISPDVFVAFGVVRDRPRRVWKAWEEGKLADFVLEVASKSTRARDEGRKRRIYERHGVAEYWQFDPTGEYLDPILQGRRLNARGAYEAVPLTTTREGLLCGESRVLALACASTTATCVCSTPPRASSSSTTQRSAAPRRQRMAPSPGKPTPSPSRPTPSPRNAGDARRPKPRSRN